MEAARGALKNILVELLAGAPESEAPLLAWAAVCGTAVAEQTRALEVQGSVLRVEVPDAAWRNQLGGLRPQYLAALNQLLVRSRGAQPLAAIEFVLPTPAGSRR